MYLTHGGLDLICPFFLLNSWEQSSVSSESLLDTFAPINKLVLFVNATTK